MVASRVKSHGGGVGNDVQWWRRTETLRWGISGMGVCTGNKTVRGVLLSERHGWRWPDSTGRRWSSWRGRWRRLRWLRCTMDKLRRGKGRRGCGNTIGEKNCGRAHRRQRIEQGWIDNEILGMSLGKTKFVEGKN